MRLLSRDPANQYSTSRRPFGTPVLWCRITARVAIAVVALGALTLTWLNAWPASASTSINYVQGAAASTGSPVASETLTFTQPVNAGDLLVGWFAQYNSPGQVSVSDNVNGAWTRSVSETFNGSGDIALFFLPNSAAAPQGLTITVTSSAPTYLQSSAAEYSGVAVSNPLDESAVNSGNGTNVNTGATSAVPAGELVYSALTTGGSPGSVTPGTSQSAPFTARASNSSGSAYEQDIVSAIAGAQEGTATLGTATDWYAVVATFVPASGSSGGGGGGTGAASFQQGAAFSSGTLSTTATMTLSQNVHAGDLLVGWFAQYNVPGQVTVSDNVNGAWTRAPNSLAFQVDTGDIALYYLADSKPSISGLTITVSAPTPAYLQGTAAEYSGVAVAGALDQIASGRGVGVSVNTGTTAPVASGELVYSAVMTGSAPGSVTPGQTQGATYTERAETASGSSYEQDVVSATAGAQAGTATLGTSADWYAVVATFLLYPNDTSPPGAPSALASPSAASSRVALDWSPGSGDLTGYAVYRNGQEIATTASDQTTYLDTTVTGGTNYSYTVEAFDGAGLSSSPTNTVAVTTPVSSPVFVQGTAASPGSQQSSLTLTLSQPVAAGDLLVGWFGQFAAPGQVQVSDNVNGTWTRGPSETFTSGTGDIALEYVANTNAAPNGLTITVTASSPAFLQESIAEFSGVSTLNPLAMADVGNGSSAAVSMGPTASVPSGDLLIGATITEGQPGSVLAGSSQGVPFEMDVQNGSASANLEDILASAAGPQTATETLGSASTSYTVVAAFSPAAASSPPASVTVTGPSSVSVGAAYSASASAAGANPAATYSLAGAPSWLSIDPNAGTVTGSVPTGITSFSYAVTATNAQGSATSSLQTVTVTPGTTSLALSPNPAHPVTTGIPVSYTATVTETSGSGALTGSVSFTDNGGAIAFCTNLVVSGGSATCTTSFATTGTQTIGATYGADPNFAGSSASVSQVVTAASSAPTSVTVTGPSSVSVGAAYSASASATGANPAATYSLAGAPSWLSIDPNAGTVTGSVPTGITSFSYAVTATNAEGSATSSLQTVTVTPGTTSLALSPNPAPPVTTGIPVSYTATVTETSGSGALTGSVSFTDNGGSIAPCTGLVVSGGSATCTTSFATTGTQTIGATYGADPNFAGSSASVSQVVTAAPQITSAATTTGTVGKAMSFTVTTTGYPSASLSETGTLPTGLSFTANSNGTATIAGTPAAGTGGSYPLTVKAANSTGTAAQGFSLVVDQAPAITSAATTTGTVGKAMSFAVTTTGYPSASLSETGALPTGLSFTANSNGTATIAGTPAAGTGGSYPLTVKAANSTGTTSQGFTLVVDQAPAITSAATTTGTVGKAMSFTVTTTGYPSATMITETGKLPTGLSFTANSNGTATIAGTPAAGTGGSYPLTVKAANSTGTASQGFTLVVDQAPAITSAKTTTGTVGKAMSFTVTTTGYPSATITETGKLPNGISFVAKAGGVATILGTPAMGTTGTYTLTITATNGVGSPAVQTFTLTIRR